MDAYLGRKRIYSATSLRQSVQPGDRSCAVGKVESFPLAARIRLHLGTTKILPVQVFRTWQHNQPRETSDTSIGQRDQGRLPLDEDYIS